MTMLAILLNDEPMQIAPGTTLAEFLETLGYTEGRHAVALNMEFVLREAYPDTVLSEGDRVEVVAPIFGG